MCSICNTGNYGRSGGCYGAGRNADNIYQCGWWNGASQQMCRDACGNVLTRNTTNNGCGCQCRPCCCPCACQCGCCAGNGGNGTAGNNGGNGGNNGVFRCITFCGYGNNLTQNTAQTNVAAYYARQYGLTCDDNAECVYNFSNT